MTYRKSKKYLPPEMYESWGGIFMPKKYEVLNKQTWVTAYRAEPVGKSLHYRLYDNSEGVAKPGEWRVKDPDNKISVVGVSVGRLTSKQSNYPAPSLQLLQTQDEDDDNILEI